MDINVKTKYFLTLTALFVLLLPGIGMASAQPNDPRCFTEEECSATRASLATIGNTEESGFYQGQDAKNTCGEQIYNSAGELENAGFCAPVGAPKTQIKFAGQQEFGNIAEFIRYIYKYSMIAGITISILMIIVAGLQYVTSAGEQTKITSAKKRISGAIMGLVLLATSYTILNTINPALVNLRLPQVWLIKSENVAPLWCADLQTDIPLALAGPAGGERTREFSAALFERTSDTRTTSTAECGNSFYLATNGQTCLGSKCEQTADRPPLPQTCVLESGGGTGCLQGNIVGRVYSSAFMATTPGVSGALTRLTAGILVGADEGWSWPWIPTSGSG
ncbi:MAG: pilin, partial [Patescibacteria group bacterium]